MDKQRKEPVSPYAGWVGAANHETWHDRIAIIDTRLPGKDREAAARLFANRWFRKPIARQRWAALAPALCEELARRAEDHDTSGREELKRCVIVALTEMFNEPVPDDLSEHEAIDFLVRFDDHDEFEDGAPVPGLRTRVLRRLNNMVVEDLLGSDWRNRDKADSEGLTELLAENVELAELEAMLELETRKARAKLTEHERALIQDAYEGEKPHETAKKLGIKPGAARTALSRARKKLRAKN